MKACASTSSLPRSFFFPFFVTYVLIMCVLMRWRGAVTHARAYSAYACILPRAYVCSMHTYAYVCKTLRMHAYTYAYVCMPCKHTPCKRMLTVHTYAYIRTSRVYRKACKVCTRMHPVHSYAYLRTKLVYRMYIRVHTYRTFVFIHMCIA